MRNFKKKISSVFPKEYIKNIVEKEVDRILEPLLKSEIDSSINRMVSSHFRHKNMIFFHDYFRSVREKMMTMSVFTAVKKLISNSKLDINIKKIKD